MWIHGKGQLRAACSEDKAEEAPALLAPRRPPAHFKCHSGEDRRRQLHGHWIRPTCRPMGIVSPDAHVTLLARCRMGLASELRLVIGAVLG